MVDSACDCLFMAFVAALKRHFKALKLTFSSINPPTSSYQRDHCKFQTFTTKSYQAHVIGALHNYLTDRGLQLQAHNKKIYISFSRFYIYMLADTCLHKRMWHSIGVLLGVSVLHWPMTDGYFSQNSMYCLLTTIFHSMVSSSACVPGAANCVF